jgi:hypothetical protein
MPTNTERIEALEAQIEQLLTRGNELAAANAQLQQQLANQPATEFVPRPLPPPHLPRETSTVSSVLPKAIEPKVAPPEYYNGAKLKLTTFITQVTLVFKMQPSRFPDEETKVLYAGSYLRDTAFLWFQPFVTAIPSPPFMQNFNLFCTELKRSFGDPDEVATAERSLVSLRQRVRHQITLPNSVVIQFRYHGTRKH